eukprot:snap_masked-scaffold_79-processed-gene-0.34-mRNA-1 protein AED:1.00 eAED:1.00 QI:0/0/0/0/1/1/2/0/154
MCLTIIGEDKPENKLCGTHGFCQQGECICEPGWFRLLDFAPGIASGDGAEKLFIDNFGNENHTSFEEFKPILFKSAPCVGNIYLLQTIFLLSLFVNAFSILFLIYFPTRNKILLVLKIGALLTGLIYAAMKVFLGEKVVYPYYLPSSLLLTFYG